MPSKYSRSRSCSRSPTPRKGREPQSSRERSRNDRRGGGGGNHQDLVNEVKELQRTGRRDDWHNFCDDNGPHESRFNGPCRDPNKHTDEFLEDFVRFCKEKAPGKRRGRSDSRQPSRSRSRSRQRSRSLRRNKSPPRGGKGKGKSLIPNDVGSMHSVKINGVTHRFEKGELEDAFTKFGEIGDVYIAQHPDGKPKEYAFVRFYKRSHAERAVEEMDGRRLFGSEIQCSLATVQKPNKAKGAGRRRNDSRSMSRGRGGRGDRSRSRGWKGRDDDRDRGRSGDRGRRNSGRDDSRRGGRR